MISDSYSVGRDRRRPGTLRWQEERAAYLFLLPYLMGLVFLVIGPIIATFFISLTNWNLISEPSFVGLANYEKMFVDDPEFWQSVRVTLIYTVLAVPAHLLVGLAVSLLLNRDVKGIGIFRTIFFLPSVLSSVAVAVLWLMLLNPDMGAVNTFLRALGIADPPGWLNSRDWAVPAVVLISLWSISVDVIIYLAGLKNIPAVLYEAATIDGAGTWTRFRHITLPMLSPTLFFTLITGLIYSFQVFDIAYILGGRSGGRGKSLLFYLINMWNEGFRNERFGYASALAWVFIVGAGIAIWLTFQIGNRYVYYENE
jgi:multiple sugar transport system permease protein